ncbi:MAG: hypothetical protein AMJ59_25440 [Gammaproteobacteria bacterium SG8_31]|nr:MAG: hypothetical protein AMJ59_25440 [Gammaproteobacteria bacterium SG8_31]
MNQRQIRKWLAISAGGAALVVALVAAGLILWLNSDPGRRWIERMAGDALGEAGLVVSLEGIEGFLPFSLSIRRVDIQEASEPLLTVDNVHFQWRPTSLLAGRLHIQALLADAVRVTRMPTAAATGQGTGDREVGSIPGWLARVRVERLNIARLEIGEAIAGSRAVWRIHGQIGISEGQTEQTHLDIARIDHRSDRFAADISYSGELENLRLDMNWHAAPGGAIAEWIGLPPDAAIDVDVTGDGGADSWRGRVHGRFGDGTTELSLRMETRDETRLQVSGDVDVTPLLPQRYRALGSGRLELSATARKRKHFRVIRLSQLSYVNDSLDLSGAGSLDRRNGEVQAEATIVQKSPGGLAELSWPAKFEGLTVSVSMTGKVDEPALTAKAQAETLSIGGLDAAGVVLRGELSAVNRSEGSRYTIRSQVQAGDLEWDLKGMERLVRGPASASLQGVIDGNRMVTVENLDLQLPDARITGPIQLSRQDGTLRAPLEVTVTDLDSLDPLARLDLEGSLALDADVYLPSLDGDVRIDVAGKTQDFFIGLPVVRSMTTPETDLTARLELAAGEGLRISDIRIEGARSTTLGTVVFADHYERLEVVAESRLTDASVISQDIGVDLEGSATITAKLAGPTGDPSITGSIGVDGVRLPAGRWTEVTGRYSLDELVSRTEGSVLLVGNGPAGETRVETEIVIGKQKLELRGIRAAAPGAKVEGQIQVPYAGLPMAGRLEASVNNIGPWTETFVSGVSSGQVDGAVEFAEVKGLQQIRLTAMAQALSIRAGTIRPMSADSLEMNVSVIGLDENAGISGDLVARQFVGPSSRLRETRATVSGTLAEPGVTIATEGTVLRSAARLIAGISAEFGTPTTRFSLTRLDGSLGDMTIESRQPASLTIGGREIVVEGLDVAIGDGSLAGRARLGTPDARLNFSAETLPLALLKLVNPVLNLTGRLDTRIDLRTENGQTAGMVDIRITDIQLPHRRRSTPLSGSLQGELASGELDFTASAAASLGEPVTVNGTIPLDVDLQKVQANLRPDGALSGRLQWSGDAVDLISLLPLEDHLVRGPLSLTLAMSGSPSDPQISGDVSLRDGHYEHLLAGTVLTPLNLRIQGDGDSLDIVELEAGDGNGGTLSGDGRLLLDPESGYPAEASLEFRSFTLLRRDEITGRAAGQLNAKGPLAALSITGTVTSEGAEVQLINNLPPEVIDLEITEIGAETGGDGESDPGGRDRKRLIQGDLDVSVELPGRVYVRGLGLDSEWGGELQIQGPFVQPEILGRLESRRGVLMFLGRRFRLESSSLRFAGGSKIDPILDIRAVYQGPELRVMANLTGPISNPGLNLSSDPTVPEDEILARALFNKSAGELSAVEAVQLAAAVGELTATGGGPGALARLREAVGVDVLRFGTTETTEGEQATTVEAGRYLAEGLYLGVETSTFEESGAVTVEYEVTKKIRLTTDLKQTGGKNIGVEYKRDY